MWVKCVLFWYSQPLTSIFGLVHSSIKKMRQECRLHPSHSMDTSLDLSQAYWFPLRNKTKRLIDTISSYNGYGWKNGLMSLLINWLIHSFILKLELIITVSRTCWPGFSYYFVVLKDQKTEISNQKSKIVSWTIRWWNILVIIHRFWNNVYKMVFGKVIVVSGKQLKLTQYEEVTSTCTL